MRLPAINRGLDAPLQHAEGPETGLSAWRASGLSTWIHLGAVSKARLPAGRSNIILRDDDAPGSPADQQLEKALAVWREAGIRVAVVTPWAEPRGDKSDFNDVLREAGLEAVRERIGLAELELQGLTPAPPPFELPTAGLAEIRGNVARTVARFGLHRLDDVPPRAARRVPARRRATTLPDADTIRHAMERLAPDHDSIHRVLHASADEPLLRHVDGRQPVLHVCAV